MPVCATSEYGPLNCCNTGLPLPPKLHRYITQSHGIAYALQIHRFNLTRLSSFQLRHGDMGCAGCRFVAGFVESTDGRSESLHVQVFAARLPHRFGWDEKLEQALDRKRVDQRSTTGFHPLGRYAFGCARFRTHRWRQIPHQQTRLMLRR